MPMNTKLRARPRAVVTTTLLALALTLAAAGSAQAVPKSFFGVMPQTALHGPDIDRMGEANVGTLRFGIDWKTADPTATPGNYDFGATDGIVGALARANIKPLPIIANTPEWVSDLEGASCNTKCQIYAPQTSAGLAAFKEFTAALAARYGPTGSFWAENPSIPVKPITVWQIWNEQNSDAFYKPKPNPKAYGKLLVAGHDGITSVDSTAEIILGGMFRSPGGGRKPSIFAEAFLAKLYDIKGIKRYFDGVAIHPYAASMTKVIAQVDLIREAIVDGRDASADIWITEIGWASSGPSNPLVRGNRGQAKRLEEAYDYFLSQRRKMNIRALIWYSWQDDADPEAAEQLCEWCPGSGLLKANGQTKPSFDAFVGYTGGQ